MLTRTTVRKILMTSTKPKAREMPDWLADVAVKIEDTGATS